MQDVSIKTALKTDANLQKLSLSDQAAVNRYQEFIFICAYW